MWTLLPVSTEKKANGFGDHMLFNDVHLIKIFIIISLLIIGTSLVIIGLLLAWIQYSKERDLLHAYRHISDMINKNNCTVISTSNGLVTAKHPDKDITYSCLGLAEKLKKNGIEVQER